MPDRAVIEATVCSYAAAWGAGDREAWLDTFAESATQEDPVGDAVRRGRDEIGEFWDKAMARYESLEIVPRDIFIVGGRQPWSGPSMLLLPRARSRSRG